MRCRICNSENIERIYNIAHYPITSGPVVANSAKKVKSDNVSIGFCFNCGSCTLIEPDPEKIHYDGSYTSSNMAVTLGAKVDSKMKAFMKLINTLGLKKNSKVLEIGCYDGSLMRYMNDRLKFDVYGCEPCSYIANIAIKKYAFRIQKKYFSSNLYKHTLFDAVVFRYVLEHIPYPIRFLCDVRRVLSSEGVIIFEIPNGEFRVKNSILGSIVPEHPGYFGMNSIRMVLKASGFRDIKLKSYKGRIIAKAKKGKKHKLIKQEQRQIDTLYKSLKAGARRSLEKYQEIRSTTKGMSNFYLFGANTCTLELLATGSINSKQVNWVIDDGPLKWNKKIVNFGIPVKSRESIKDIKGEKTVVICSYYSHEKLFNFLRTELTPPFKILRLYPNIEIVQREATK